MSENFSQGTEVKAVAKRIRMAPNKFVEFSVKFKGKVIKKH